MNKKSKQQEGYDLAKGVTAHLGVLFMIGIILIWIYNNARNTFNWGLDDSDRDGGNRSGLIVHTDATPRLVCNTSATGRVDLLRA